MPLWLNTIKHECRNLENYFSENTDYPYIIFGIGRVLFGTIQAIIGFIGMLFSLIPGAICDCCLCGNNAKEVCKHSFAHFVHGIGNIITGSLQAIPGVGFVTNTLKREIKCLRIGYLIDDGFISIEDDEKACFRL